MLIDWFTLKIQQKFPALYFSFSTAQLLVWSIHDAPQPLVSSGLLFSWCTQPLVSSGLLYPWCTTTTGIFWFALSTVHHSYWQLLVWSVHDAPQPLPAAGLVYPWCTQPLVSSGLFYPWCTTTTGIFWFALSTVHHSYWLLLVWSVHDAHQPLSAAGLFYPWYTNHGQLLVLSNPYLPQNW